MTDFVFSFTSVASTTLKSSKGLKKLKQKHDRLEKFSKSANSTLSAEFVTIMNDLRDFKHATLSFETTHTVDVGTIRAEMEILRDDMRTMGRERERRRCVILLDYIFFFWRGEDYVCMSVFYF